MYDKLDLLENQSFAWYGLTRFLMLLLLRECLDADAEGRQFCLDPLEFVGQPHGDERALKCVESVGQVVLRLLNSEVKRRAGEPPGLFDYKRVLKSPKEVRDLASTVVSHYQIAVDAVSAPTFSSEWEKSKVSKSATSS